MARRQNQFLQERFPFCTDVPAQSATATVWGWKTGAARSFAIDRGVLNALASFGASATDFWTVAVKVGSTVVASWSTQSTPTGQGALTASTPVDLVNNATPANLVVAAATVLTVVVTKTGAPANFSAFNLVFEGRYL